MALDKSKVDGLLIDFVVRNQSDLQSNQKENPALYDAVLSALSVLARKFGSGQVLADPVPAAFYTTPEPEPAVPSNALNFEIGDVFDRKGAIGIKFFIKQINIESDKVLIANLENENDVLDYSIGEVENKFNKKIWLKTGDKFMPLPNKPASKPMYFKVGDVFYTKGYKDIKYYIFSIDKQTNDVLVGSVSGAFSGTTRYDGDEANRYLYDGTWVFTGEIHMPPSTPAANTNNASFEVGDEFYHITAPSELYYISRIQNKVVTVASEDDKILGNGGTVDYREAEVIELFKDGSFVKTGKKVGQKTASKLPFKDGDIFQVSETKRKYVVMSTTPIKNSVTGADEINIALFKTPTKKYTDIDISGLTNNLKSKDWEIVGNINDNKPTAKVSFKQDDIFDYGGGKKFFIKKIDGNEVMIAEIEYPAVIVNSLAFDKVQKFFDKGDWKVVGNMNDNRPTMLPIKLGDVIADSKLKQDFLVRYIDPYTDAVHLAEFGEPNLTAHKYSFSDAMAYLNNGRFVIKPKTYSKSAPPPDPFASLINKPKSSVTTAIKKTAAKTKKVVSPEEKELLDAIKTLKPLVGLDPDIQKEIDELNVKLTALRNKKD